MEKDIEEMKCQEYLVYGMKMHYAKQMNGKNVGKWEKSARFAWDQKWSTYGNREKYENMEIIF